MPKPVKTYTNTQNYRTLPYPTVISAATMPTHTATTSTVITPPPPGGDRHSSSSWPSENDEILMHARQQGLNWQPIAFKYFPDKTPNACRKRHERLMEKRNSAGSWDSAKIETLAKAYNDVREQMWRVLADRIGSEKWQTVEAKVCKIHQVPRKPSNLMADNFLSVWRRGSKLSKRPAVQRLAASELASSVVTTSTTTSHTTNDPTVITQMTSMTAPLAPTRTTRSQPVVKRTTL